MADKISVAPILTGICVALILAGCAGSKATVSASQTLATDTACSPVTYKKLSASAPARPPWALIEPDDENGKHSLIGLSGFHATERDAREDAMRHAREEFARYTGVEVMELDQMSREIYGSSSAILDPTVSGKTQTTHETDALVSRVKADQYYFETLRGQCGGRDLGTAYQYWVLAGVPVEEYDKVQAWKAKREAAKAAEKAAEQAKISEEVARFADLIIDVGRDASVFVASDDDGTTEIRAWVWRKQQGDQLVAAASIPLLLKESGGSATLARAKSDANGQAVFQIARPRAGAYEVTIDPQGTVLAASDGTIQSAMAAVGTNLSVVAYTPDLPGAAKAGVRSLFRGPAFKPLPVMKVVMGPVQGRNTRVGSEFGKRLETHIVRELPQISGVQVIPPPTTRGLDQLESVSKARGIGMNGRPVVGMGDPAVQAQLDGADGALNVTYALEGKQVAVDLSLTQAGTGALLAAAGALVDQRLIPDDLELAPHASPIDLSPLATGKPGEIRLELTTHRGDGVTFAAGEKITYYVSSDRDAYLLLLYQDAENHLIQIYPNARSGKGFHTADNFMKIPDESDAFEFTIEPPFGVEQVWAFAVTEPFPTIKGKGLSNGLTLLQQGLTEVATQLRAHGKKAGVSYGEANVVVTTVKE